MSYYEVTVTDSRYKTLLVSADSAQEAEGIAIDSVIDGEIGMDDAESDVCAVEVIPASDRCYELHPESVRYSGDTDDDDCDVIFECERCPERAECDNETKLRHMKQVIFDEFKERMHTR